MNKQLVILGAGGHAKVCYEIAVKMKQWNEIIVLDDNKDNKFFNVRGRLDSYFKYPEAEFFVAIGNNNFRQKILLGLLENNYPLATLIDPSAIISSTASIDSGSVVMPGVIVNANVVIGVGVILNTACTLDHDCIINNYVHVSPGANLAGNVNVGSNCWLGIGTTIIQDISITDFCIIGAGSVVVKSIDQRGKYVGVPVRLLHK